MSEGLFNQKTILVTGGTGSFGNKFVEKVLAEHNPRKIIIFSRDEMKQWEMQNRLSDPRLRFFQGDVRDKDRLKRAFYGVDIVVHAAALKIVPSAEYNPFETIKTNVFGAMNIIDAAIDEGVKRVVALSTDKACNPINLYGATKLCSDKLFIAGNSYTGSPYTRFAVVRYGNVMGSRGSIIPFFLKQKEKGVIPITDKRMTRFMITLEQGVDLVFTAVSTMVGGEVYVKKIPSMKVTDIARVIAPNAKMEYIGIRPGEKIHESMISVEDSRTTYEFGNHYRVYPCIDFHNRNDTLIEEHDTDLSICKHCAADFHYSSDTNSEWMHEDELRQWIRSEYPDLVDDEIFSSHVPSVDLNKSILQSLT